ncbi:MAG: c-type cytochrome biogenesis protein CcsB [Micrococcales bacterium]|nr:c-type cytochrome biogenesis protein CcsB [Micrococcales bacterium]
MTPNQLADISLIAVYSAIAVYVLAFVAFTLDLSARSARVIAARDAAASAVAVRASGGSGVGTAVLERPAVAAPPSRRDSRYQRIGTALVIIAWLVHVTGAVIRGFANGHVPWTNMFEFAMIGTAIMVGVFLVLNLWRDVRFLGTYITGIVAILLGVATVNFYVQVTPLPPALQSAWLVVHVFVATLGTGFFAVGAGLSILQLMQTRRDRGGLPRWNFLATLPTAGQLESVAYRVVVVGFVFWTFTLIAGAIWAERAWGRYWGWDTKEVWTFIIWVLFAGYIHARATRGWRGSRAAYLAIIGFGAVLFNYSVVNLFFKGLHAYSGL